MSWQVWPRRVIDLTLHGGPRVAAAAMVTQARIDLPRIKVAVQAALA